MIWKGLALKVFLLVLSGTGHVFSQETDQDLQVHYSISQTAIFPGDTIIYYLDIETPAGIDILVDDLDISRLNLTGMTPVDSEIERTVTDSGNSYQVRYYLTSFELESALLQIGEQSIRFYVQDSRTSGVDSPEREVLIPGFTIALRSTLPAELPGLNIRESNSMDLRPYETGWMMLIGLVLIFLSVFPVILSGISLARRQMAVYLEKRAAKVEIAVPGIIDDIVSIDSGSEVSRREGYDLVEKALRGFLAEDAGIPAQALTASELSNYLPDTVSKRSKTSIVTILEDCQHARYGRPEQLPSADRYETAVATVQGFYIER